MARTRNAALGPETENETDAAQAVEVVEVEETDDQVVRRLYRSLAAPFDTTFKRVLGGKELTYISGEQVVSRLNDIVGPHRWSWEVDHAATGINEDEARVMGTLTITFPSEHYGVTSSKVGFGGCKIKRFSGQSQNAGKAISIANDFKAADTDAFKKAAAKFGVGLYLSERDPDAELPENSYAGGSTARTAPATANRPAVSFPKSSGTSTTGPIQRINETSILLNDTWFRKSNYTPVDLGQFSPGQVVTVTHKEGKTFIDGMILHGVNPSAEEEPDADF